MWARIRRRPKWRDDRGIASIELVLLAPLLLALLLAAIQAGLWFYARNLALTAAQESTHVARGTDGNLTKGQAAGYSYLERTSNGILTDAAVSVSTDGDVVTTTVTGQSISLIPGVKISISQSSSVPVEKVN